MPKKTVTKPCPKCKFLHNITVEEGQEAELLKCESPKAIYDPDKGVNKLACGWEALLED